MAALALQPARGIHGGNDPHDCISRRGKQAGEGRTGLVPTAATTVTIF